MILIRAIDLSWWLTLFIYLSGGFVLNGRQVLSYIPEFIRFGVVLGILGLMARIDFQSLSIVKGFGELSNIIRSRQLPKTLSGWTILLSSIYLIFGFLLAPLVRHWTFQSWLWDMAVMEQIIWRGAHGLGMTSTILGSPESPIAFFPNNHANFWLFPIAWIYRLAPYTETLLLLQSLAILLTVIPLYKIGQMLFEPKGVPAIILPVIYWCWDTVHRINVWDFHDTPFMAVMGVYAFLFFLKKQWFLAGLFTVLMALLKEDAWITAGAMGFYFCAKNKKFGLGAFFIMIGAAIFLGHAAFLNKVNTVSERYYYLGNSVGSAINVIAQNPLILFEQLTKAESLYLIWRVICIGAGTWLLSGWAIVPILPTLLVCALSTHEGMLSIQSHHIFGLAAPLMFATALGISNLSSRLTPGKRSSFVALVVMISALQLYFGEPSSIKRALIGTGAAERRCFASLVSMVPANAPVYAYNPFAAHLANRPILQVYESGRPMLIPGAYILVPEKDPTPPETREIAAQCGFRLLVRNN